jgi:hypothetical protein
MVNVENLVRLTKSPNIGGLGGECVSPLALAYIAQTIEPTVSK